MSLPAAPSAATTARLEITRGLSQRITGGLLEDVRLLLTELITNALRHSDMAPDDEIGVRAELSDGTVRIEVRDPGRDGPVRYASPAPSAAATASSSWSASPISGVSSAATAPRCGLSSPPDRLARLAFAASRLGAGLSRGRERTGQPASASGTVPS